MPMHNTRSSISPKPTRNSVHVQDYTDSKDDATTVISAAINSIRNSKGKDLERKNKSVLFGKVRENLKMP